MIHIETITGAITIRSSMIITLFIRFTNNMIMIACSVIQAIIMAA